MMHYMFRGGLFILLLTLFGQKAVTLAACAGIGVSVSFIMVAATALLQGESPPEMRGRVSSSSMALISIAQGIAMLFAGDWATRFGIIHLFYASALMLFVVALGGVWKLRRMS